MVTVTASVLQDGLFHRHLMYKTNLRVLSGLPSHFPERSLVIGDSEATIVHAGGQPTSRQVLPGPWMA